MSIVRPPETISVRSSVTDGDLEEARQRLLDHMEVSGEDPGYDDEVLGHNVTSVPVSNGHAPNGLLPHGHAQNGHLYPPEATLPPNSTMNGNTRQSYGSMSTVSVTSQINRKPLSFKRYRLPFLILLSFDWGLVVFFSIVVMMNNGSLKNYFNIELNGNYFDLVVIATFRVAFNFLFYLVLGWVNRSIMGLVTIVSALYLPLKAYYSWSDISDSEVVSVKSIAILIMLLVTFGMPWITAFFFEFKFLPAELARLSIPSWWSWKAWLWPQAYVKRERNEETPSLQDVSERAPMPRGTNRPRLSASTMSLDFRTPVGSSRASPIPYDRHVDDELEPIREHDEYTASGTDQRHSPECDQTMSAEDLRFKREALSAMEAFKDMTVNNDGWVVEKNEESVTIYSKMGEKRKAWRAECVIQTSARNVFNVLYPGDETPEWNPQCGLNETVYRVDDSTDLIYTISNAVGPISSRDFVSIRQMEISGGSLYAASKAIVTALKPEQPGKVRAENGPCGYLVIPISANQCKFVWVLNSNLKGWLPQTVIDQTLTGVLNTSMDRLKAYVTTRPPNNR